MFFKCIAILTWIVFVSRADGQTDHQRRRTPVVEAYECARESVVNITGIGNVEVQRWGMNLFGEVFPVPTTRNQRSIGSGIIIHEDGYIVTNAHVVASGAQLGATLLDGTEHEARVIGRDNDRDLAVIKIDAVTPLKPISMGHSSDIMIGEQAIAVGNPVGLHNTVTVGVVSALHRELEIGGRVVYRDVIQTDASINPGNSGGALLNILGELIGINTAIRSDAQNIGFAIPVDQLREILPSVLDSEKLNKVVSGFRINGTDPPTVAEVREGSLAAAAGLRVGDVISTVNARRVDRTIDFLVAMLCKAGETARLDVVRGGKSEEVRLALVAAPKPDGKRLAHDRLGLSVEDAKEDVARRFLLRRAGGVIVMGVEPRGPADRAGVKPGDMLVLLGPYPITDCDILGQLLAQVGPGDRIEARLLRIIRSNLYESEVVFYAR
jgi:serine protease Do